MAKPKGNTKANRRLASEICSAWGTSLPTVTGYYWYRNATTAPMIVHVRAPWKELPDCLLAYWTTNAMDAENVNVRYMCGDWCGPLAMPNV